MDYIVDFHVCQSLTWGKNSWSILILVNIGLYSFGSTVLSRVLGEKSVVFTYEIAPHSGEFASFRRQAWSNAPLFPGYGGAGLSTD